MKETAAASHIRLDAAQQGIHLWRNNSGVLLDERGTPVRFGLGSFQPKDKMKSSDYIGITPVLITSAMVGQVIGVFTAIETKRSDWRFNIAEERTLHQKNFLDIVASAGGLAGFARNVDDFRRIIHAKR